MPKSRLERSNPVPEAKLVLEYDVYGKFKFAYEPEGVFALGRAWVGVAELALADKWEDDEEAFDAAQAICARVGRGRRCTL